MQSNAKDVEMSLDIAVQLFNKLVARASCPAGGHCYDYDQSKLAICGHRICAVCCKTKKNCSTCGDDVNCQLLQEDILMVKLVKAIQHNLRMFRNLHSSEDVTKKFQFGKGWSDTGAQVDVPSAQNQEPHVPIREPKRPNNNKILVKSVQQDDFDKIECIEESQPYFIKEKEIVVGPFDKGTLEINHKECNASLRRSTRCKTLQDSENIKQTSNILLTKAIVEDHVISKINDAVGETKSSSNKSVSKPKHWNTVKRMKKEFGKSNKPDIKKLNISIEMCNKKKSATPKQNISKNVECTEPLYSIEDDTPHVLSPPQPNQHSSAQSVQVGSIQACGKHKSKSIDQIKSVGDHTSCKSDSSKEAMTGKMQEIQSLNSGTVVMPENDFSGDLSSQVLVSTPKSKYTQRNIITPNIVAGTSNINMNSNPQSQICRTTQKNKNEPCITEKLPQPVNRSTGKRKFSSLNSREKARLIKQPAKGKLCKQYKRRHEKRIGILNITTPEGKFVITGENICVLKPVVHCKEKSTQTDQAISSLGKLVTVEDNNDDDTGYSMFLPSVKLTEKKLKSSSLLNKMSKNTDKTKKTNTASVDTATAPLKITEDILDGDEESDIFNTCSGVNKPHEIATEIPHSEIVGDLTQISQTLTQRSKRQLQNTDESLRKKAKSHNNECITSATKPKSNEAVQNSASISVEVTQKPNNDFTGEFDDITRKTFAQIDADLYEHNKKNKNQAEATHETEYQHENVAPGLEVIDENALSTLNTTQNKVVDIDSDGIEDTPQKEKPPLKRISTHHNAERTANENLRRCTVDTGTAPPKETEDGTTEIQDIQSPLSMHLFRGITCESTPLRTPRRSLDFNKLQTQNLQESVCVDTLNGASDVAKTTLEKEFMEKAFEKTPHVAPPRRRLSLKLPRDDRHVQVACSCLLQHEKMDVIQFAKKHKLEFVETYTPKVTHLIVGVDEGKASRTVKYVNALAAGIWILSFEWISECIKNNRIVDEAPYEVLDMSGDNGPKLSRLAKTKIFEGMIFYCHPPFVMVQRQELEAILKTAGGRVASNIEEVSWNLKKNTSMVSMAIMEPQSTLDQEYTCLAIEKHVIPVNFEWAFNCLGSYSLQPLLLLCPLSLIPVASLHWPHKLFDISDSNDEIEIE